MLYVIDPYHYLDDCRSDIILLLYIYIIIHSQSERVVIRRECKRARVQDYSEHNSEEEEKKGLKLVFQ